MTEISTTRKKTHKYKRSVKFDDLTKKFDLLRHEIT